MKYRKFLLLAFSLCVFVNVGYASDQSMPQSCALTIVNQSSQTVRADYGNGVQVIINSDQKTTHEVPCDFLANISGPEVTQISQNERLITIADAQTSITAAEAAANQADRIIYSINSNEGRLSITTEAQKCKSWRQWLNPRCYIAD